MIHFLYKWLLWKRRYIIEMNTFRNSLRKCCDLLPLPHAVSLFGFCCVCAHVARAPLCMRMQMHNGIVIQSYLHSCTTRFDVMWCHNVMYNTEILKIWTLRVQIALSLRQDLNIIGFYWKAQYDSLQPHICIMHAVINDDIICNNNLVICYGVF